MIIYYFDVILGTTINSSYEDNSQNDPTYDSSTISVESSIVDSTNQNDINLNSNESVKESSSNPLFSSKISSNIDAFSKSGACDNSKLFVQLPCNSQSDKRHACFYCHKLYPKIARHLETKHKNETIVKKFASLPKGIY